MQDFSLTNYFKMTESERLFGLPRESSLHSMHIERRYQEIVAYAALYPHETLAEVMDKNPTLKAAALTFLRRKKH
jgi:hypothetical protein